MHCFTRIHRETECRINIVHSRLELTAAGTFAHGYCPIRKLLEFLVTWRQVFIEIQAEMDGI
jgi:hypothetical protein